ncbi:MAG: protein translocase subunit SecD [Patescibacteria group bacterium]
MTRERKRQLFSLLIIGILAVVAVWFNTPWRPQVQIGSFERDLSLRLGLDLQGGSHLIYRADIKGVPEAEIEEAVAGVRDVIERRVNAFGISQPIVQTSKVGEERRIVVELAGVHNPETAISLIGATPQLDFRKEVSATVNVDDQTGITGPTFERTALTGRHLKRATVDFDQVLGAPQVGLEFDGEGSDLFAALTRESVGKRVAIYLDGIPISAPVVQTEITNGQAIISGGFSLEEAKQLARNLRAGALPVPIELIGQQTIGPTLGRLSIQESIAAGLLGLIAVAAWMITFYRLPGLIASIALVLYAVFFLAIIRALGVTMTLAGVAGFILSIGMAVDANVLIFERLRENLRAGKTIRYALTDGFREAWSSIRDSNVTGLLSAIIMYYFGSSIIRGFAVTLAIGTLLSMFTAITITRALLHLVMAWKATHRPFLLAVKSMKAL